MLQSLFVELNQICYTIKKAKKIKILLLTMELLPHFGMICCNTQSLFIKEVSTQQCKVCPLLFRYILFIVRLSKINYLVLRPAHIYSKDSAWPIL
jgi:hypothetical protein